MFGCFRENADNQHFYLFLQCFLLGLNQPQYMNFLLCHLQVLLNENEKFCVAVLSKNLKFMSKSEFQRKSKMESKLVEKYFKVKSIFFSRLSVISKPNLFFPRLNHFK